MITRIATIAVYVESQQEALSFWSEQMGFEVRANHPMGPNSHWIEVAPPQAQSCLVLYPKSMMPQADTMKASIVFECEDVQGTYERLRQNGVTFPEEPQTMQWGTYVRFQDQDGNEYLLKG